MPVVKLEPWSHPCSAGFILRGEHSPPSGKPVIHFLHGNGFCGRTYEPLLAFLARDFDLFLSDVQGHGNSDSGGRFHGWNRTAELCIEAWRAHAARFGAAPASAVGHSFGGVITSLMLAREPALFRGAVLLDPVIFTPAMIGLMALSDVMGLYSRNVLAQRARRRRRHWPDRESVYAALHERGMFAGWTEAALWAYVNHALKPAHDGGVELKCAPSREAEIFGSFPRRLWSSLARLSTPTLVLYGERTYGFVPRALARWHAVNALVETRAVPGGHCFMQEDPQTSARLISEYLRNLDGC